ncbi:MAG: 23S rRNA (uracil(1939)-C(5))-methyltransferase RlmD [Lachnoclostridium sp.]|nr:23S rRNA (uracil(1939)-C(5))-methyltransferase RlmD [Lachnoclostridium sp.]
MKPQKNDILEICINDLGNEGEGIGHLDNGYTLFVKGALPGELVRVGVMKAGKSYGYARLLAIIKPSKERVKPACPLAGKCGGCTLQHLSYEGQLRYKQKKVMDCLERISGIDMKDTGGVKTFPIIGMDDPWHYRNKAQFPVGVGKDGKTTVGVYAGRSHSILPIEDCKIQDTVTSEVRKRLLLFMKEGNVSPYDEASHTGTIRHIYIRKSNATGEVMVCLIVNESCGRFAKRYSELLIKVFGDIKGMVSIQVNENRKKTNVIMGENSVTVWGKGYIEDRIGNVRYMISGESFFQVNPKQTLKLYETVLDFADLKDDDTVWDMYCGIGTISLFLAKAVGENGKVVGVEIVERAIKDARINAELNGLKNVRFVCGSAENIGSVSEEKPDAIVLDPPRKGCDEEVLRAIGQMKVEKVVYVSCNPGTLARDVKLLGEMGYEVGKVQAVDFFPMGHHVETVVLLSHKKPDSYINVKVEFGEGKGKVPLDAIAERAEEYKPKERVTYKMI